MKENFITSIIKSWGEDITQYISLLQEYPIKLVLLIIDLSIVIWLLSKITQKEKSLKINVLRLFSRN